MWPPRFHLFLGQNRKAGQFRHKEMPENKFDKINQALLAYAT